MARPPLADNCRIGYALPPDPSVDLTQGRSGMVGWRRMTQPDLARVERVADVVHPDYPEDDAVFAERLRLYAAGCLVSETDGVIQGYAIGHPCLRQQPPALNTLLGGLPRDADCFHIHDLALLPAARGLRLGNGAVDCFVQQARAMGLAHMSLIAVGKSLNFWRRNGFEIADQTPVLACVATFGDGALLMTRTL